MSQLETDKEPLSLQHSITVFFQRVINRRKSLSEEDISVSSVNSFKHRLEKRNRQMDFFKDS